MRDSWFRIKAAERGNSAEVAIFGEIGGFGISAQEFFNQLKTLGARENLYISISSDGGDVSTGFAIYNMLNRNAAYKVVTIEGLAASMASVVAMSGDEIVMPSNAMMMVHNPWGAIVGESNQIASFAEALQTMQRNIAQAYKDRTGLELAEIRSLMDQEKWMSAREAVNKGFADRIEQPLAVNARAFRFPNLAKFNHVPARFAGLVKRESAMTTKPSKTNRREENNNDEDDALSLDPKTEQEIRSEVIAQHKEIRALCNLAGKPELADTYIDDSKTVADVIADLDAKRKEAADAASKKGNVNAHNIVDQGEVVTLDPVKIWDKWNSAGKRPAA